MPNIVNNNPVSQATMSIPLPVNEKQTNQNPLQDEGHTSTSTTSQQSPRVHTGGEDLVQSCPENNGLEGDLELLNTLRSKYTNNPSIGYLNINSLRGSKFPQLNELCKQVKLDILCVDETKLTNEIPTSRFHIDGYQYPPHKEG